MKINDKHIEVIVRQMLQKVRITEAGDSRFLEGDQIDRIRFNDENDNLKAALVVTDKGDSKLKLGQLISRKDLKDINDDLKKRDKTAFTRTRGAYREITCPARAVLVTGSE